MVNVKNLLSEKARISLFSAGFTLIFSIEWTIYTFPFIHIPPETIRIIPFEFTPIIIELLFFFHITWQFSLLRYSQSPVYEHIPTVYQSFPEGSKSF